MILSVVMITMYLSLEFQHGKTYIFKNKIQITNIMFFSPL